MNKLFRSFVVTLLLIMISGLSLAQDEAVELDLAVWGNSAELQGFQDIIDAYEADHPNVTINLLERPGDGMREQVVAEMAAGEAPDIVRAGFRGDVAFYASAGGVIDLSPYLEEGFSDDFFEGAWTISNYDGAPYSLPLHSDTHAIFYNKDYFEQIGVEVPQTMDECWSWDEFNEVSARLRDETDADYGHVMLWNGKRWLMFLYGNGGQLLNEDHTEPAIVSPEGIETIEWTQGWYQDGLAPLSTSMKYSVEGQLLFINGAAGMMITGSWWIPWLQENMTNYGWGVTYLPCSGNGQDADLGGTGLAVTKDSEYPEIAADFIKFATNTENMQNYAVTGFFTPVRYSALEGIEYPEFSDEMTLFGEVAQTTNAQKAAVQGMEIFPEIDLILRDELELAFTSGQSAEQTAQNIADKITRVLED